MCVNSICGKVLMIALSGRGALGIKKLNRRNETLSARGDAFEKQSVAVDEWISVAVLFAEAFQLPKPGVGGMRETDFAKTVLIFFLVCWY